jgi:hypothetical protein
MHKRIWPALCLFFLVTSLRAQDFTLFHRNVQVHGFASEGIAYTNQNNWLTMNTAGSPASFTDFGANLSTQLTDRLWVGAQVYDRSLGHLGQWHPSLDWAVVSFKIKPWLAFRGGKVKTTLGLYNDTQDLDFLRTFALLPQSIYPTDLRDATMAHTGGDVYGDIPLKHKLGTLSYTGFAGHRSDSIYSGYPYLLTQFGSHFTTYGGLQYGADLRWTTPITGLMVGASRLDEDISGSGTRQGAPLWERSRQDWMNLFYGRYTRGRFQIDAEARRYYRNQLIISGTSFDIDDVRGWYVSGTYRVSKRISVGSYYSHYTITSTRTPPPDTSLPRNHDFDKVVSARFDVNRFWNVKVEGHFMDGFGADPYPNGFYPQVNPTGFKPNTNALVVKTGVNF